MNGMHACPVCNKSFPQKSQLDQHVKDTKHVVEFFCRVCEMAFDQEHDLKLHFSDTHGLTFTDPRTKQQLFVNEVQARGRAYINNITRSDYLQINPKK